MGISDIFFKTTGMSVTDFAKAVGLPQGEVWNHLKSGYCSYPRIPKDGRKSHPLYQTWKGMMRRCFDKNLWCYKNYGGRGISVCLRWRDFKLFAEDLGNRRPINKVLDRINNDGDYTPENTQWVSAKENCRKTSANTMSTWGEETLCIAEWSEILEIPYSTLRSRLRRTGSLISVKSNKELDAVALGWCVMSRAREVIGET